jgi:hypothetical protein
MNNLGKIEKWSMDTRGQIKGQQNKGQQPWRAHVLHMCSGVGKGGANVALDPGPRRDT